MRDVLALHGFTGRGSDFGALAAAMPGVRFATPDLPGHGPAPRLPAGLDACLATIYGAVEKTAGPPVLLGYSMGGRIALHAALATPERFAALVLIGASPGLEDPEECATRAQSDRELAARIRRADTASFLTEWDANPLLAGRDRMPEPWRTRSLEARRENRPEGLAASLDGVGTGVLPSLWNRLPEIRIPVLVISGAHDTKFTVIGNRMAGLIPGARTAVIAAAGHATHLESPEAVAPVLRDFI